MALTPGGGTSPFAGNVLSAGGGVPGSNPNVLSPRPPGAPIRGPVPPGSGGTGNPGPVGPAPTPPSHGGAGGGTNPQTNPGGWAPNANPQVVRASGDNKGFSADYLQNLATFAGGMSMRPTGGLYINPLSSNPLGNLGSPMTLGNAPQYGLQSLIDQSLSQPYTMNTGATGAS